MTSSDSTAPRPPVRWWPALLLIGLTATAVVYIRFFDDAADGQLKFLKTGMAVVLAGLLLLLWVLTFSRLPWKVRLAILGAVVLLGVGFRALFRVTGFDGNMVPILAWRFGGEAVWDEVPAAAGAVGEVLAGVSAPGPDDFPQFLGPWRDGRVEGPRLARDWDASPPKELWRREIGEGWSAFAVAGDAAVTQEQRGEREMVVRYDLASGEMVWSHADVAPFTTSLGGNGPRSTPTIADGRVYTLGPSGLLSALDLVDGALVWQRNILDDHEAANMQWGLSGSPLVMNGRVIVQAAGEDGSGRQVAAYDRDSGELLWAAGEGRGSYGSPLFATLAGVPQVLAVHGGSVSGHDPATGDVLWSSQWPGGQPKVATPLVLGEDRVLVSAGYGVGSRVYRFEADGAGGITAEQEWESLRLKSKFANMVLYDGVIYGLDDGILAAVDPATGERLWKRGRYGHGQIVLSHGLLVIQTEKGDVVLVEATPDEHRELGRLAALGDKTWNPPTLAGNRLLVRNHREAVCYELPVEGSAG